MKVKVTLKFRGREMAHTEFGFQVVQKFLADIAPYGHPDFEPKLIGRGINVMISPLPRNKRARNPYQPGGESAGLTVPTLPHPVQQAASAAAKPPQPPSSGSKHGAFANNPFAQLEIK